MKLAHNISWTLASNLVYGACQWGLFVVIAKVGTPEMLGQFSLGIAISTPLFLLFNLNLRVVQATDAKNTYAFSEYFCLRLLTTIFAVVALFILLATLPQEQGTASVVALIAIGKAAESINDVFYGLLQKNERMDRVSISMMIKGLLSFFALAISLYLSKDIIFASFCFTSAIVLSTLLYDLPSGLSFAFNNSKKTNLFTLIRQSIDFRNQLKSLSLIGSLRKDDKADDTNLKPIVESRLNILSRRAKRLRGLAFLALPAGILSTLLSLSIFIPRYVTESYLGAEELGFFSAILYVPTAGIMLTSAMGQSALPRLSKYYASNEIAQFYNLLLRLVGIALLIGLSGLLVSLLIGKQFLTFVYNASYSSYVQVFQLLMLMATAKYVAALLGTGAASTRKFKGQLLMSSLISCVTLAGSLILIPKYGLYGASIAQIIDALARVFGWLFILFYATRQLQKGQRAI